MDWPSTILYSTGESLGLTLDVRDAHFVQSRTRSSQPTAISSLVFFHTNAIYCTIIALLLHHGTQPRGRILHAVRHSIPNHGSHSRRHCKFPNQNADNAHNGTFPKEWKLQIGNSRQSHHALHQEGLFPLWVRMVPKIVVVRSTETGSIHDGLRMRKCIKGVLAMVATISRGT